VAKEFSTLDNHDNSFQSSLRKAGPYNVGCSKMTVVLKNATDNLGRASSLGGESFDPPRECIDHYKDVGVVLVIRWKRSDVVYVKTLE
jgi:hypothetical protein